MSEQPNTARGIPDATVWWLAAGVLLEFGALLILWLGTAPWTDYAFWVLMVLAAAAVTAAGIRWIDQEFADSARPDSERRRAHE